MARILLGELGTVKRRLRERAGGKSGKVDNLAEGKLAGRRRQISRGGVSKGTIRGDTTQGDRCVGGTGGGFATTRPLVIHRVSGNRSCPGEQHHYDESQKTYDFGKF